MEDKPNYVRQCPGCNYMMSSLEHHLLRWHMPCPRCEKFSTEEFLEREEGVDRKGGYDEHY